jgi:hypothetical protein
MTDAAQETAARMGRIANLEEIVGVDLPTAGEGPPLVGQVADLSRKLDHLARRVESTTQQLVAQANALRLLGLVPCMSCSTWFRADDSLAGLDAGGGLWFCAAHVHDLAGMHDVQADTVDRLSAWLVEHRSELPAHVLADTMAASHAVNAAVLSLVEAR